MILTDFIRNHCMEDFSIIKKSDLKYFNGIVFNDNGETLRDCLYSPYNTTFVFNKGFVIFNLSNRNGDGYNDEVVCELIAYYKAKDSKHAKDFLVKNFWHFLKVNKCSKVLMFTKINPEFWEKNYGFKTKRYEMELKI